MAADPAENGRAGGEAPIARQLARGPPGRRRLEPGIREQTRQLDPLGRGLQGTDQHLDVPEGAGRDAGRARGRGRHPGSQRLDAERWYEARVQDDRVEGSGRGRATQPLEDGETHPAGANARLVPARKDQAGLMRIVMPAIR